ARRKRSADSGTRDRAPGAIEEGTPVSILAEVAETLRVDQIARRSHGLLRRQGDSADRRLGGRRSAEPAVTPTRPLCHVGADFSPSYHSTCRECSFTEGLPADQVDSGENR